MTQKTVRLTPSEKITGISNIGDISRKRTRCVESPRYSCALSGVLNSLNNIHRVIPIIHAGAGCGQNQNFRSYSAGGQGTGYVGGVITPSTNFTEKEVIFGGEDRLREQIQSTLELIDGDLYVVVTGCIPNMIGDDVKAVVGEFQKKGVPIIAVISPGFSGDTIYGYEILLEAIIAQYLNEPVKKVPGRINLLGVIPYHDVFWRGDLREIKRILERLGIEVNTIFGDYGGVSNLKTIPSAELNIVLSPWVGVRGAELLKEKFGTPYLIAPLPSGLKDSTQFVKTVGKALEIQKKTIDEVIKEEEKQAVLDLDVAGDMVSVYEAALPVAIVANSTTSLQLSRYLANEPGFTPTTVIITDNPPEQVRKQIHAGLGSLATGLKPKIIFEEDSYHIKNELKNTHFNVLLASSQERFLAEDLKAGHISVSFPVNNRMIISRTYAGYRGGITLVEDIMSLFLNPF